MIAKAMQPLQLELAASGILPQQRRDTAVSCCARPANSRASLPACGSPERIAHRGGSNSAGASAPLSSRTEWNPARASVPRASNSRASLPACGSPERTAQGRGFNSAGASAPPSLWIAHTEQLHTSQSGGNGHVLRQGAPKTARTEECLGCMREGMVLLAQGRAVLHGAGAGTASTDLGSTDLASTDLAEVHLQNAAGCFARAHELDPTHVPALGQAGNALLALGELKLRLARQIRAELRLSTLHREDPLGAQSTLGRGQQQDRHDSELLEPSQGLVPPGAQHREDPLDAPDPLICGPDMGNYLENEPGESHEFVLQEAFIWGPYGALPRAKWEEELATAKGKMAGALAAEAEEALVEAGRRYRAALHLDRCDPRAFYNWGLALCFRAQLVMDEADKGFEAVADRMLEAAMDKLEVTMSLSHKWRRGGRQAMQNMGLALRDRSRLRPLYSQERVELLREARVLLRDALRWDPSNAELKEINASCAIELDRLQRLVDGRSQQGGVPMVWQVPAQYQSPNVSR